MMLKSNEKVNNLPIELEAENGTEILFQSKNYESINGMNQKISFETDDIGKSNLDCQQQRMLRKQTIGQMIQSDNVQSCRRRASNEKHNDCMKDEMITMQSNNRRQKRRQSALANSNDSTEPFGKMNRQHYQQSRPKQVSFLRKLEIRYIK
ncbi:hypothetical protein RDWZM_001472 [Blomia tropicalis]|uniref:Uncharacterized protein n=1 Tax=Blomia tropicalis TaxID=40697 RepID=A0A9Q0MEA1_BLOTA|nr:hypothetical protein RDWZM_001472 [Blomia tropicalis]